MMIARRPAPTPRPGGHMSSATRTAAACAEAAHLGIGPARRRRTRRWHSTAVSALGVGALLLSACSSDSDDTAAATETESTDSIASADTTASTTAAVQTTTPDTQPPDTQPPDTQPPDTQAPAAESVSLSETIVAEGTSTAIQGSRVEGPAGPDGRTPLTSLATYEGDLVGEATLLGSYVIGDETVDALSRLDFSGELAGIGAGTFTGTLATTFGKIDGTGEGAGRITGGTGVFTDVVGTITTSATDFGTETSYRIEFIPADQADAGQVTELVAAAAEIADEVASSFTARDFVPIQRLLGAEGTWIAIDGEVYDAATVTPFLEEFDFIESIERTDQLVQSPDGVAFEMSETFTGGGTGTFWLVVSYDDTGALVITELTEAPPW